MNKELKALQGMKQLMQFWPYLKLVNELELALKSIDEEILDTIWEWRLRYTSLDLKRVERKVLQTFINMPLDIIKEFDNIIEVAEEKTDISEIPDWLKWSKED